MHGAGCEPCGAKREDGLGCANGGGRSLGVLVVDLFGTVFVPRGGAGVITSRLYQAAWAAWSRVATRAGGQRRRVLVRAADLTTTAQPQAQYPLIAYFHIPRDDRALPVALADLLELVTLCRALPDASRFPALTSSPTIVWASRLVTTFVIEHADQLGTPQGVTMTETRRRTSRRANA